MNNNTALQLNLILILFFSHHVNAMQQSGSEGQNLNYQLFATIYRTDITAEEQCNIITELITRGACVDARDQEQSTPLMIGAKLARLAVFRLLLARGANPALINCRGSTLLHFASAGGSQDIVSSVDDMRNNSGDRLFAIDIANNFGIIPLMSAIGAGQIAIARWLIAHGADPLLRDKRGWTLLHFAAANGDVGVIEFVYNLRHDSWLRLFDIDTVTDRAETPIMISIEYWHSAAVCWFLDHWANSDLSDGQGNTLLHYAAAYRNVDILKIIGERCHMIDIINNEGMTPLMTAVHNCRIPAMNWLIERGANARLLDRRDFSLLHYAAQSGNELVFDAVLELLDVMGKKLFCVDVISKNRSTPLMTAASCGSVFIVRRLIGLGAHVNALGPDNDTALHTALSFNHRRVAEELVLSGACIDTKNARLKTPLDIAREYDTAQRACNPNHDSLEDQLNTLRREYGRNRRIVRRLFNVLRPTSLLPPLMALVGSYILHKNQKT